MQAGGDDDEGELAGVHHPHVEADDGSLGAARGGGAARRGALLIVILVTLCFTSLLTTSVVTNLFFEQIRIPNLILFVIQKFFESESESYS